jgi:hypothetical protein
MAKIGLAASITAITSAGAKISINLFEFANALGNAGKDVRRVPVGIYLLSLLGFEAARFDIEVVGETGAINFIDCILTKEQLCTFLCCFSPPFPKLPVLPTHSPYEAGG